ncbi:MAG TPA: tryptophan--tRNA ligase [Deinococcales bacterium]|nr:tryptophan--tRNA ligase [Deinococcales bacterium]
MKRVLSGIQPTGNFHIGNYLGAVRNWVKIGEQVGKEALFCVVDYHAITIPHDPKRLGAYSFEGTLVNMAAGLDPDKVTLFAQSHVPEHTELAWVLATQTPLGDLERMTQFKDKSAQHSVLSGLLFYPVLMAADILIYKADTVPVGDDQVQHLELTREIARRFNYRFGNVFPEPRALIDKNAARVKGLDGSAKMSKSKGNTLGMLEPRESLWEKIRVAPTDPARVRRNDPGNPFICLIYHYHTLFSAPDMTATVERECSTAGIGCVQCKQFLMQGLMATLDPIQERAAYLREHPGIVTDALVAGAEYARSIARETMGEVREAIGLLPANALRPDVDLSAPEEVPDEQPEPEAVA